jgi:hypothetical protein
MFILFFIQIKNTSIKKKEEEHVASTSSNITVVMVLKITGSRSE